MSWQPDPTIVAQASAAQRLLLNPAHHVWVGAHAGTGKTETLTRRIAALLLADAELNPSSILALTYTKAGAGEMQVRLPERLTSWAALEGEKRTELLAQLLGRQPTGADHARLTALPALLNDHPLWVTTIHGLCSEVLGRFPAEAGVPVGFTVLEESQQQNLLREAQRQVLAQTHDDAELREVLSDLVETLGDHQVSSLVELVTKDWDNLLAVLRNSALSHGGIAQKLAAELEATEFPATHPATNLLPQWQSLLESGGSNSKKHAALIAAVRADPGSPNAWEDVFFASNGTPRINPGNLDKQTVEKLEASGLNPELSALQAEVTAWLTAHRAAAAYRLTLGLFTWVARVRQAYEVLKTASGGLDFADLINHTQTLLANTEKAWVLYRLDRDIKHILLDEAQDNSSAQNAIFRALADELVKEDKAQNPRTVLVVGDDKQSIYRFQGAAPRKFTGIRTWLTQTAAHRTTTGTLAYSFRSATQVLQLADAAWHGENPVTEPHHTVRPAAPGFAQLHLLQEAEKSEKTGSWLTAEERQALSAEGPISPAVLQTVREIVGRMPLACKGGKMAEYQDILILCRKKSVTAKIAGYLSSHGVPTLLTITNLKEPVLPLSVQDYLALLEAALNPHNKFALGHVLVSPFVGWPQAQVAAWLQNQTPLPTHVIPWLEEQKTVLLTRGKAAWLAERMAENHPAADADAPHYLSALMLSAVASDAAGEDPASWLETIRTSGLPTLAPTNTQAPAAVRIMTIHGAKGLEAPLVIIPEPLSREPNPAALLWEEDETTGEKTGVLYRKSSATPPRWQQTLATAEDAAKKEDTQRLLYVALTRAQEGVFMFVEGNPKPGSWGSKVHSALTRLGATTQGNTLTHGTLPPLGPAPQIPLAIEIVSDAPAAQTYRQTPPPLAPKDTEATTHGTLVHNLLATLPALPREEWARTALLLGATPDATAQASRIIETFPDIFTGPALTEHELTLPTGTSGRLDRLVIKENEILLVDFKTDRTLPTTVPEQYVTQLQSYMQVLQPQFTQPLRAVLLYTSHAALLPVPEKT